MQQPATTDRPPGKAALTRAGYEVEVRVGFPRHRFAITKATGEPPTIAELATVLAEQGLNLPDGPPAPSRSGQ